MSPKPHVRDSHGAVGGTALCPGAATAAVPVRSSSRGPPCPLCGAGGYGRATGDGSMAAAALVWFSSLAGPVRCCGVGPSVGSAGLAAPPCRGRAAVPKRLKRGPWAADTYRGLPRGLGRAGLLHHRPATASAGPGAGSLGWPGSPVVGRKGEPCQRPPGSSVPGSRRDGFRSVVSRVSQIAISCSFTSFWCFPHLVLMRCRGAAWEAADCLPSICVWKQQSPWS